MASENKLYNRISDLVADNRLGAAIDLLEKELPRLQRDESGYYHAALLLLQDYNDMQQRRIQGLMVASTDQQSISLRLLELTRDIDRPRRKHHVSTDPLGPALGGTTPQPVIRQSPPTRPAPPAAKKGNPLGKVALYILAGFGGLLILALIIDATAGTEDTYDPEPYTPPGYVDDYDPGTVYTPPEEEQRPAAPVTPPPEQQPATKLVEPYRIALANTVWESSFLDGLRISFNSAGTEASVLGGTGIMSIQGKNEYGQLYGRFNYPSIGQGGTFVIEPPFNASELTVMSKSDDSFTAGWDEIDTWSKMR